MIMVGGATRLTHSGLSIVEWKPISGIIPPLNQSQWVEEFAKYQQFPEYKLVNATMTLPEFQSIYWMEYSHRLLGRLLGLWFGIPLLIFWVQERLSLKLKKRTLIALGLSIGQGLMGWYMVKSGLITEPNVSPYRLTAHLALATIIYGVLFWTALEIFCPSLSPLPSKALKRIQRLSLISCITLTLTILYGSLVAGLKAGLIYNTFPLMEGQFIPSEWAFYQPLWLNFFENAAFVQWIHRWLAFSTVILVLWTAWQSWNSSTSGLFRKLAYLFGASILLQATLGVSTLLLHVPITLGTLHQGMAIIVLSFGMMLYYYTRVSSGR